VDLPGHPVDKEVRIMEAGTPFGNVISAPDPAAPGSWVFPSSQIFPTNATAMNITVAIQKLRAIDLDVKPPN